MSIVWLVDTTKQGFASDCVDSLAKNFAVRIVDAQDLNSIAEDTIPPNAVLIQTHGEDLATSILQHRAIQTQLNKSFFVFMNFSNSNYTEGKLTSFKEKTYTYLNPCAADLLALLKSVLPQSHQKEAAFLHYQGLHLNMETLECWIPQEASPIPLSFKEAKLLRLFFQSAGRSLSRNDILSKVWDNVRVSPRTIDCYISRLRKKLANAPINIASIYGDGYIFS